MHSKIRLPILFYSDEDKKSRFVNMSDGMPQRGRLSYASRLRSRPYSCPNQKQKIPNPTQPQNSCAVAKISLQCTVHKASKQTKTHNTQHTKQGHGGGAGGGGNGIIGSDVGFGWFPRSFRRSFCQVWWVFGLDLRGFGLGLRWVVGVRGEVGGGVDLDLDQGVDSVRMSGIAGLRKEEAMGLGR